MMRWPSPRPARRSAGRVAAIGMISLALAHASQAHADNEQAAEALFAEGKRLLGEKDYAHACPKLAESFALDPATGTLLALALCHERQGKLASAATEYAKAAARSKLEARPDRERAAQEKVAALGPQLSTLTIAPSPEAALFARLEIKRNGVALDPALWKKALAVDGGAHTIEAVMPGKKPWRKRVMVAGRDDRQTVTIPALEDESPEATLASKKSAEPGANAGQPPSSPAAAPNDAASGLAPARVVGITTLSAGLIGLGLGTYFTYRAIVKNNDSKDGCDGNLCDATATQDRLDARSFGNMATVGFVAGGALVVAGVATYLAGARPPASSGSASARRLELIPLASSRTVGGIVQGSF